MNQAQQAVSEQSRKLKELKNELNQIKSGSSLNRTTIKATPLDETTNNNKSVMFLDQSRINQTQINTTQLPHSIHKQKRAQSKEKKVIEYVSSSSDDDTKVEGSKDLCHQILSVFTKVQKDPQQPQSRSLKMQHQFKLVKIKDFLSQFEISLQNHEAQLKKEAESVHRNEEASERRKETATRMISDLEKKLFESERERVILRREREDLTREIRDLDSQKEKSVVSKEMIDMIKENQKRLEESNRRMQEMVARQEKEMRDKEEAWSTQLKIMKDVYINAIK